MGRWVSGLAGLLALVLFLGALTGGVDLLISAAFTGEWPDLSWWHYVGGAFAWGGAQLVGEGLVEGLRGLSGRRAAAPERASARHRFAR